jgi:hypothetical protein
MPSLPNSRHTDSPIASRPNFCARSLFVVPGDVGGEAGKINVSVCLGRRRGSRKNLTWPAVAIQGMKLRRQIRSGQLAPCCQVSGPSQVSSLNLLCPLPPCQCDRHILCPFLPRRKVGKALVMAMAIKTPSLKEKKYPVCARPLFS